MAKRSNPGKGAFKRCVKAVGERGGAVDPRAVCAAAGRRKYGARKFAAMAQAGKRASRRRNPVDAAIEAFEEFHGAEPKEILEFKTTRHEHGVTAALGDLIKLKIRVPKWNGGGVVTLKNFKGALLTENEKRTQLFVEGGDQEVDLGVFGIERAPHEVEHLGACTFVAYHTTKKHLGREGGTAIYEHTFGEGGTPLPQVIYRVRDKQLEFAGGGYTIPKEGIDG